MIHVALVPLAVLSACTPIDTGVRVKAPPPSYIEVSLRGIANTHQTIDSFEIGQTRQGRVISVLRIAAQGDVPPDERPALLLVADAR